MAATARLRHPLRRATYKALIGLLAVTGMRIGEAIRLDRDDVDWASGLLVVHSSKFGRSREVPLHCTSLDALRCYADLRDELQGQPRAPSFFVSHVKARLVYVSVCHTFRRLVDLAALPPAPGTGRLGRVHDLRHSFCVRTLVGWYRDDLDVESLMPVLSTFVGHTKPVWTYWYLDAAPELMTLAADRLQRAFEAQP
jgi:integrase